MGNIGKATNKIELTELPDTGTTTDGSDITINDSNTTTNIVYTEDTNTPGEWEEDPNSTSPVAGNYPHEAEIELTDATSGTLFIEDTTASGTVELAQAIAPATVIFHVGASNEQEILRFEKDKMFLYGKETECPEDIIEGMRAWLGGFDWFENKEKARKYDELMNAKEE